jgi:hypothetical protein
VVYKSDVMTNDDDDYAEGTIVLSNHEGRPDANSMNDHGPSASEEDPWELRLKTFAGKELVFYATQVMPIEGQPSEFLLSGYTKEAEQFQPCNLVWNVRVRSGVLKEVMNT